MPFLFTQANTYSPVDCGAGLATVLLYPTLLVWPKLTDRLRTAPPTRPVSATAAMARVLDFMIVLPFAAVAREYVRTRERGPRRGVGYLRSLWWPGIGASAAGKSAGKSAGGPRPPGSSEATRKIRARTQDTPDPG